MDNNLMKADIIDYLGKYENGVLVLLSVSYKDTFTEGTLYYSDKILTLTVDESIEKDLGQPIEFWSGYREFLESVLKKVVPYNEIINRLDEVDFTQYGSTLTEEFNEGEDIDEDDIESLK